MIKHYILLFTIILPFSKAIAQESDTLSTDTVFELNSIQIVEKRFSTPLNQLGRSALIIPENTIKSMPIQSVSQLLSHQAGIDVRQRGVNGVQADIGIRGSGFDQSLVLLNGVKLSDPQTGHHLMSLPISPLGLSRVEIFKSTGARHYGANAFAGVINLISKPGQQSGVKGDIYAADFGSAGVDVIADINNGNLNQRLQAGFHRSDGYRYNTDYTIGSMMYFGQLSTSKGVWEGQLAYSSRAFGANGFYASEQFKDQWEQVQTALGSISYSQQTGAWKQKYLLYHRSNRDHYLLVRDNPSIFENRHRSEVTGLEYNVSIKTGNIETASGAEIRREFINSTNLGTHERYVSGLFLEQKYSLGQWGISPGIYLNYFSDGGLQWYPGIEVHYESKSGPNFFGNITRSFRLPTYTDLFYIGPTNIGNENLRPENSWNFEIGMRQQLKGNELEISIWRRATKDLIDWVRQTETEVWQPVNFVEVAMTGLDIQYHLRPGTFTGNQQHLIRSWTIGYSYIYADYVEQENILSRYALNNLRHQLNSLLLLRYSPKLEHSIAMRYADRVSLEDYFVLDTRVSYQIKKGRLYLEANNLLNAIYRETDLVPMPGRWIKGGWQFEF